jgi:phage tail protein X
MAREIIDVVTKEDGDERLDQFVGRFYGGRTRGTVEAVLDANPALPPLDRFRRQAQGSRCRRSRMIPATAIPSGPGIDRYGLAHPHHPDHRSFWLQYHPEARSGVSWSDDHRPGRL